MKLFFINWSGKDLGLVAAVKELQLEHRILYWTCPNIGDEVNPADFPCTILHEHADALQGKGAKELSGVDFPPPSEALLKKMYEAESIVLTMMNKHFENRTVSERKHLYIIYVQYWDGILKKYKPDAVIFPTIPHTSYDFVVYALAKVYGVKTVMMEPTWVGDRMVIMTDYKEGPQGFPHTERTAEIALRDLSEDLQEEYKLQTRDCGTNSHYFVKHITKRYSGISAFRIKLRSLWTTITVLKDFSVLSKLFTYVPRRFRANQKTEYEGLVSAPDYERPFVYFPLHYQPERNSSPQGGVFVDQILMARTIAAALPEGWFLYIKEHPTQWLYRGLDFFSYRFKGYYKALAAIRNAVVVPIETSSSQLQERSRAVATITGTAGWEALLNRKPVLIFGYPWYRYAPGIFKVQSVSSCREAILHITEGASIREADILEYLHRFDSATFHGYIDRDGQQVSALPAAKNAENISKAITSLLAKSTKIFTF